MVKNEYDLMEIIQGEKNVVIYGAKKRAGVVIERIRANNIGVNLFIAVSNCATENQWLAGIQVRSIYELEHLKETCNVIISTQSIFQDEIENLLKTLGFKKIIRVNEQLFSDLCMKFDTQLLINKTSLIIQEQNRQSFMHHRLSNQMKLSCLRDKYRRNEEINVLFILTSEAKFSFSSVYKALEKNDRFNVSIFIFGEYFNDNDFMSEISEIQSFYNKLKRQGYNVIWGYDSNNQSISIEEYAPDIIFYNAPYLVNRDGNQLIYNMICNHLACYLPYGIEISNEFEYHFEHKNILPAWIQFVSSRQAYDLCANNAFSNGLNAVLSGNPIFDEYKNEHLDVPEQLLNGNKNVIYAPHWSIATWHNTSTFHLQYEFFENLREKNPAVNFVFKPHPRLEAEIRVRSLRGEKGIPNIQKYKEYCERWNRSVNGIVVTDSSFVDLFKVSDCLITDSYSFLATWLQTEKPCIFLTNPQGDPDYFKYYYGFVHSIIEAYYVCGNEMEIEERFIKVLSGEDYKLQKRREQKKEFIYNNGSAGMFIADYIEKQIKG